MRVAGMLHNATLPITLGVGVGLVFRMTPDMASRIAGTPWDIISASTTIGLVLLVVMTVVAPVVQMATMKHLLEGGVGLATTRRVRAAAYAWFLVTVVGVVVLWFGSGRVVAGVTFTALVHAVLRSGVAMLWLHWFLVAATDPDSFREKPKATGSYV